MDDDERAIYDSVQAKKLADRGVAFAGGANAGGSGGSGSSGAAKVSTLNMTTEEKMQWLERRRIEVKARKEAEKIEIIKVRSLHPHAAMHMAWAAVRGWVMKLVSPAPCLRRCRHPRAQRAPGYPRRFSVRCQYCPPGSCRATPNASHAYGRGRRAGRTDGRRLERAPLWPLLSAQPIEEHTKYANSKARSAPQRNNGTREEDSLLSV